LHQQQADEDDRQQASVGIPHHHHRFWISAACIDRLIDGAPSGRDALGARPQDLARPPFTMEVVTEGDERSEKARARSLGIISAEHDVAG